MYTLKNGILYKDGVAHIALGQSYYPSYHPQKVPVLETGDRMGEMVKDLKDMKDAGFNIVRMAALGKIELDDNNEVSVSFPFIDEMLKEASRDDLATMVRLQGYSINLHGYENATMQNQSGEEMPFYWSWFVRNCLNHPGILEDNERATLVSAEHFGKFDDMVSFQIYNEAAYPTKEFYDYNPKTIESYRKWLIEKGLKSEEEAKDYEPPRRRPYYDEDPQEWVNFRLFNTERMSGFLNNLSDIAKKGYQKAETLTCHMASPFTSGNALRGQDYFDIAERMDIVGITHYVKSYGPDYYLASLVLDGAECAASTYGKNAWLIEYNARTACTLSEWERETYNAIGSAFKGIMYYQWRADFPFDDAPEPNGFGMVFNNGDKTEKYDGAVRMTKLIDSLSPYIAESKKVRSRIGILYSKHANAYYDAIDNGDVRSVYHGKDRNIEFLRRIYTALKDCGITPDIVRSCDLSDNPLGIEMLFVPSVKGLSETETEEIAAFAEKHTVFNYTIKGDGYIIHENCNSEKIPQGCSYSMAELISVLDYIPAAAVRCPDNSVSTGLIEGSNKFGRHYLISLTNHDGFERAVSDGKLNISDGIGGGVSKARWITPYEQKDLVIEKDEKGFGISLPKIDTGAFVILYNGDFTAL
ncbi:MAG: beta-galactosidase [Bacillota bacterium]|nr:beta-galactosidase [Bacillota bacterium]